MESIVKLSLLVSGACYQLEKFALRNGRLRSMRFPATFALIEHDEYGNILFDTGYSSYIFDEAKHFPFSLYPKITPIEFNEQDSAINQLKARLIPPESIRSIIISHFHIDHIGGIMDFPNSEFICTQSAARSVIRLSGYKALLSAFMPGLLPDRFWERVRLIDDSQSPNFALGYPGFDRGYDLLGDGSLVAASLPGHATGQIGLFVKTEKKIVLLAADACWSSQAYKELIYPHPIARLMIADNKAFDLTLKKLHHLHTMRPDITIIPTHSSEDLCSIS